MGLKGTGTSAKQVVQVLQHSLKDKTEETMALVMDALLGNETLLALLGKAPAGIEAKAVDADLLKEMKYKAKEIRTSYYA